MMATIYDVDGAAAATASNNDNDDDDVMMTAMMMMSMAFYSIKRNRSRVTRYNRNYM